MTSNKIDDRNIYHALSTIQDVCRYHLAVCKNCPLSIQLRRINAENKEDTEYVCRVYNQQYKDINRPALWRLQSPTIYTPFKQ